MARLVGMYPAGAVLIASLLAAVPVWSQQHFQSEIETMKQTIEAFDSCSSLIENAATPREMTAALETTASRLENVLPDMTEVGRAHPDWGDAPPDAVSSTMVLFHKASRRFFVQALARAVAVANENSEDRELRQAFARVNKLLNDL